jgi:hypothetical protein
MSTKANDLPVSFPPSPTRRFGEPPPYPEIPLPDVDARTHALRVFARWLSALVYRRTMAPGMPSEPFSITPDRVFIEQPDNVEGLQFPAIGILPGRGSYLTRGIGGTEPDDATATVDGLALLVPYDYQELITVEGWGSKIAERRSIVAAIEVAMGTYEGTTDLRLIMPNYYGLVATFSLMERENLEDESVRGRRRVHLFIQMTVPVVTAARFLPLIPNIAVNITNNGLTDGLGAKAVAASAGLSGEAELRAMGIDVAFARQIARATLGLTQAQATELTEDYLLALIQTMAAENASLETARGRPPYSPGETVAQTVFRGLPRTALP